ncbi:flavoprotein [Pilimelia anulata]|uniref:flavoprotein n=1 Tax=Pilimelia anulata TaxID=53371 RepID=UPI001E5AEB29|nr:flavoprotein [Pilimelia anulata]
MVCAAPPARRIGEFVAAVQREGWTVHIIATPTATSWLPVDDLAEQTGSPVRHRQRHPDEQSTQPMPDALAVVPATFNTINKWATGINDSLALGVLNGALGTRLPIVASPYAKADLAAHPAFDGHLRRLADSGVRLTTTEALRPADPDGPYHWSPVLDLLRALPSPMDCSARSPRT